MKGNYCIALQTSSGTYKLCRILFGKDGSYYVTAPYHPAKKAILTKHTVNYTLFKQELPLREAIEIAQSEDEDARIKLSHHPSGLVQFSGKGIESGLSEEGQIKGIGVQSWKLQNPVRGPAFAVTIYGVTSYEPATKLKSDTYLYNEAKLDIPSQPYALMLEGYYFEERYREFVTCYAKGKRLMTILHPSLASIQLGVILPSDNCELQGFLGLRLYAFRPHDKTPSPSFMLSGSTGNIRRNDKGEKLGDGIYCMYPRITDVEGRTLDREFLKTDRNEGSTV